MRPRLLRANIRAYTHVHTFPEVALGLSCHLAHDLWSVDEEEEGSSFIGHCPGNQGLASTRWTIQEDATRGLGEGREVAGDFTQQGSQWSVH